MRITGTSCEDPCTFIIIPPLILLRMRNVSDKSCSENENKHFRKFFQKPGHLCNNVEECGRTGQATHNMIGHICFA
jgi:hypothetical protein